jgi:putative two-component system response regulator
MPRNERECVLVVDDTPANLDLMKVILQNDYRVKIATNGANALRLARQAPPDLILLDIMMPDMDGYEVCRQLKTDVVTRKIPVIFVTAMGDVDDERRGFEVGAVDYITKPVSPPIVQARVRAQLDLQDQARVLNRLVDQRTRELEHTRMQVIRRLGRAAEFKDNETGNHIIRMSHYSRAIALAAGLYEDEANLIFNAAPMHDVGKIGIPDVILLKPAPLDAHEWEIMYRHPLMGADIIGRHDNDLLDMARVIALTHHERWDGTGYPHQLKGEEIPIAGRITAIADVYDALISDRPYKSAWSMEEAVDRIKSDAGSHFDPDLVNVFLEILPEIQRIQHVYREDKGSLLDLEFVVPEP